MASTTTTRYIVAFAVGMTGFFNTYADALGAKLHHCLLTGKSLDEVTITEYQPAPDALRMAA